MSNRTPRTRDDDFLWWSVAIVSLGVAVKFHGQLGFTYGGQPASENKPFRSVHDFYPFYLTEHRNAASRVLHVVGTTIFWALLLLKTDYRRQIPNLIISISVGTVLCEFLSPLETGAVEFMTMLALVAQFSWMRGMPVPWILPVVGYSFAWVGHFFLEQNRPATFVYPSYSLLCDFLMWSDSLRGRLPLTENLEMPEE